jgi:hypothetical protein
MDIDKNKLRLRNAQTLMLDGEFNPKDYEKMKVKIEEDINRLSVDEDRIKQNQNNHYDLVDACLYLLKSVDKF